MVYRGDYFDTQAEAVFAGSPNGSANLIGGEDGRCDYGPFCPEDYKNPDIFKSLGISLGDRGLGECC